MKKIILIATICASITFLVPSNAIAAELIINGGFETGVSTPWTLQYSGCTDSGASYFPMGIVTNSNPGFGGVLNPLFGTRFMRVPWTCGPQLSNGVYYPAGTGYMLIYQDVTVPAGNAVTLKFSERLYTELNFFTVGDWRSARPQDYRVQIRNTSNAVLQNVYSVTAPANTLTSIPWTSHTFNLGAAYAGQTIRIAFLFTIETGLSGPGNSGIDGVSLDAFVPTAADSSIGGRVATNEGAGISRAKVTLTNSAGVSISATTNSRGYYKFDGVVSGDTYVLTIRSKKYLFTNNPRVINVQSDLTEVDFIASP